MIAGERVGIIHTPYTTGIYINIFVLLLLPEYILEMYRRAALNEDQNMFLKKKK